MASTRLEVAVTAALERQRDLGVSRALIRAGLNKTLTFGQGDGQANAAMGWDIALGAGASTAVGLGSTAVANALDQVAAFTALKAILLRASAANAGPVSLAVNDQAGSSWAKAPGDGVKVHPGGMVLLAAPEGGGWPTAAEDQLVLVNSDLGSAQVELVVVGIVGDVAAVLQAPSELVASAIVPTGFDLTWQAPDGDPPSGGYRIYLNGAPHTTSATVGKTLTGLLPAREYTIEVTSLTNTGGESQRSQPLLVATGATAPTAPTALTEIASPADYVRFSWTAGASTDGLPVRGHIVWRGDEHQGITSGTEWLDATVAANTTYQYRVQAYTDQLPSALSAAISITTDAAGTGPPVDPPPAPDTTAPTTPTLTASIVAVDKVRLTWTPATDASGIRHYVLTKNGTPGQPLSPDTLAFEDAGLTPGETYHYELRATDNANNTSEAGVASATLPAPSVWTAQDIGAVGAVGSFTDSNGTLTVVGSGADIWAGADEFHFAHRQVTGDFVLTARVNSLTNTNEWAKAGLMFRESLAPGAKFALMCLTPTTVRGAAFQYRTTTGGSAAPSNSGDGVTGLPRWLRITRVGDVFTGLVSPDGVNWTERDSRTILMAATIYLGLAVTSHADGTLATAVFDNVTAYAPPVDVTAPTVPAGLDATAADYRTINLSWSASTDAQSGVAGYRLRRGGTLVTAGLITGTSYQDTGLAELTQYSYTIQAVDNAGNASAESAAVLETTLEQDEPAPPTDFPYNLAAREADWAARKALPGVFDFCDFEDCTDDTELKSAEYRNAGALDTPSGMDTVAGVRTVRLRTDGVGITGTRCLEIIAHAGAGSSGGTWRRLMKNRPARHIPIYLMFGMWVHRDAITWVSKKASGAVLNVTHKLCYFADLDDGCGGQFYLGHQNFCGFPSMNATCQDIQDRRVSIGGQSINSGRFIWSAMDNNPGAPLPTTQAAAAERLGPNTQLTGFSAAASSDMPAGQKMLHERPNWPNAHNLASGAHRYALDYFMMFELEFKPAETDLKWWCAPYGSPFKFAGWYKNDDGVGIQMPTGLTLDPRHAYDFWQPINYLTGRIAEAGRPDQITRYDQFLGSINPIPAPHHLATPLPGL